MNETTLRDRVESVVNSGRGPFTGREIARMAGEEYKRTIDALNALLNYERIARLGKKATTRWVSKTSPAFRPTWTSGAERLNRDL